MSDRKKIFPEEIELSEIVLNKTNQAFELIKQEDTGYMKKSNIRSKKSLKKQAAAVVGVCILAISSISVAAAVHHYWGRGMSGNLQASDEKQQELTENGMATVYREDPDYPSLAVTDNGITVAPETVIVDDRFAYMSFKISGYNVADGEEPGFYMVDVYQGDDPEDDGSWINMYGGAMYDGIIPDENGHPVYENGSPLEFNEDGGIISCYTDSNGNMEYIIHAGIVDQNDSLLGKKLHVNFTNLGVFSREKKGEFTPEAEGDWNFEIILPDVSSAKDIKVEQEVEGTGFVMESINISPISMKVNYSVIKAPEIYEDENGIPRVQGVVLKDGTRLPYLTDGGGTGYTDSTRANAYHMAGYDRVIDVDEVVALIVLPSDGGEKVEIPIAK